MSGITTHRVGIIMNGVTGRMGTNQHLMRSIVAIMRQGGIRLNEGEVIMPDPVLVGRNPAKLQALAASSGVARWTTDCAETLADPSLSVYFDAQTTARRVPAVAAALDAGKHVYCEKPTALATADAVALWRRADARGLKHGVVQDKLWLPGLLKLKMLVDTGYFGRILAVRGEFGYWVFEGDAAPAQRPSWNYRAEDGGGILLDMFAHWRYVLDRIVAPVTAVSAVGATHIPRRWDERGAPYDCTAEDAAYATFTLEGGIIAHFNSSWCVRVRRDDLLTVQVDGTEGSAVAGLRRCCMQPKAATPRAVWNPDLDSPLDFDASWLEVPDQHVHDNAFKAQWDLFLRHVVKDEPFPWSLREGAKGVQLAELGLESWRRRAWVDVPALDG